MAAGRVPCRVSRDAAPPVKNSSLATTSTAMTAAEIASSRV